LPLVPKGTWKTQFMVNLFTVVVVAIISLIVLNYVIKDTGVYRWIVSAVGAVIALFSFGTIPVAIISMFKKNISSGIGFLAVMLAFSKSKICGILRSSFLKAIVYVAGIWALEVRFNSLSEGLSQISSVLVAFGPIIIMLIGIGFILKSVKI